MVKRMPEPADLALGGCFLGCAAISVSIGALAIAGAGLWVSVIVLTMCGGLGSVEDDYNESREAPAHF
jgi:hypothetical protein